MKKIKERIENKKNIIFEIIAIVLICLFSYSIAPKTLQNDTYYTVSIGNLILEKGIDMKDHFSWHNNLDYTYPHWLYDIGMSLIYNKWSWNGIYVLVCIMSVILGLVIYKVNSKIAKNQPISFLITIGSIYLLKPYIAARAQLATFIIFIGIIYLIEKFIENPKKIYYGIGIILASILIANLHLAVWPFIFILSLPYIGEYIISILADIVIYQQIKILKNKILIKIYNKNNEKVIKLKRELEDIEESNKRRKKFREEQEPYKISMKRNKNIKWLILVMLICGLTGLITPLGTTPYTYLYKTIIGNTTSNINEHLPLTLANNIPIMCTIIIVLSALSFTKVKIKLSDLFMLGGLTYLMFLTRRQQSMFVIIGSIILNKMICEALEINGICKIKDLTKNFFNFITAVSAVILIIGISNDYIKQKKDDVFVSEKEYPIQASDWILQNLDVNNIKLYNEYNYGSYLLYRGIPVFIDSRADLYAPEFNNGDDIFMDFINTSNISKYYGDTFKKYEITHIIVHKNAKIRMLIDKADQEKYSKIYADNYFVIYEYLNK